MHMGTNREFGSTFRDVRKRRQLRIKQVSGTLNQSAISHFENSNSDIRLSSLINIIPPTCMSFGEFFQLFDIDTCPFLSQMKKLSLVIIIMTLMD